MIRTMTGWLLVGFAHALVLLLVCAPAGFAQKDSSTRSVQGVVTNPDESTAVGAVVQLKNQKTLQVRSFITKEDGGYHFFELSPDVDYELKADFRGTSSGPKTLSSFDSRKKAVINLKLNKK
jgi:Carboxypeptidase regulatory-like domain